VSEFVPAIPWEEATKAGHVWQRRFYDFRSLQRKQAHREVALHGGLAHLSARRFFQRRRNPERLYTKNSGRLAAALHFS
jgi:hypothetical protein